MRELSRVDLELALDVCAAAVGEREFIVVGAISILGPCTAPPAALLMSADIDLFPRSRDSAEVNAVIAQRCGAGSEIEDEHGFYVESLGRWTLSTALPGWEDRLVKVESPAGVAGWCLIPLRFQAETKDGHQKCSSSDATRECREALDCGGLTPLWLEAGEMWKVPCLSGCVTKASYSNSLSN